MQKFIAEEIPQNSLILYNDTRGHLAMMFYAPQIDIYNVPMQKYLVLFQNEVRVEENHLKNIDQYEKIYHLSSLWDFQEFSDCLKQFNTQYDNKSFCFKEIDKQKAIELINSKKELRELSFHKTSL